MHPAEVKNIVNEQIVEYEKKIASIGCQTPLGCGKTKEIEGRYGKIQSDLNDLSVAFKKAMEILEGMKREISGVRNLVQIDEKDMQTKMEKIGDKIKDDMEKKVTGNRRFIISIAGIIITLLAAKLFQDYQNQNQTIGLLTPMLASVAVLKDHDEDFQKHLQEEKKQSKIKGGSKDEAY